MSGTPKVEETRAGRFGRAASNLRTILMAVGLAMVIRVALFEAFEIEGPSMEPTLLNGDRVVVAKFIYGLFLPFTTDAVWTWNLPSPGSVVIVKSPADDIDIVKRVVGVPGDTIEIEDDVLYRNGEKVTDAEVGPCDRDRESPFPELDGCTWVREKLPDHVYRTSHSIQTEPGDFGPEVVPPGHVFVLGDHRDRSNDSRYFGFVPASRVKGRALFIYWSKDQSVRWHRLGHAID